MSPQVISASVTTNTRESEMKCGVRVDRQEEGERRRSRVNSSGQTTSYSVCSTADHIAEFTAAR